MDIPVLIYKCLAHGIQISPYQLRQILKMYETYKIPDEILNSMSRDDVKKYIDGLYLSGHEMSNEWSRGHVYLQELGFTKKVKQSSHREFVTLVYN